MCDGGFGPYQSVAAGRRKSGFRFVCVFFSIPSFLPYKGKKAGLWEDGEEKSWRAKTLDRRNVWGQRGRVCRSNVPKVRREVQESVCKTVTTWLNNGQHAG